jgi:hypothetical protein
MLNTFMNDAYRTALFDVVKDTTVKYGYDIPEPVEAYVVMLLASHVDKPDFLPETFAHAFFQIQGPRDAKQLADTCLFVTGVFPTMGKRKGLNRRYYQDIGSTSYSIVAETQNPELFKTLSIHFNFLSEFIEATIHSSKQQNYNLFR